MNTNITDPIAGEDNRMTRSCIRPHLLAWFTLTLLLLLSTYMVEAQEEATEEPDTLIVVTSEPFEVIFGSGPFNLFTPIEGLSDLSSYRATLSVSFDGTNSGQPEQWSRVYTLLVTQSPSARQLTIDNPEDDDGQVYMAEVNNISYERRDGSNCFANPVEAEGAFAEQWELAGFLDSVMGADEAGAETVNDVDTNHYTFDESAQGASGIADSTGELWVASDGGYLVRYTLTTTGSADYFGEGIEGTMTWDYELTDVNQPVVIEIPEDCPPPLLNVPVMPDASDVFQMPGSMSYTTSSTVQEVAAFYEEQAASGGQPANPPLITESSTPFLGTSATVLFGFTLGDQSIMLIASSVGEDTNVQIQQMADPAALSFTAEVPTIVIAPEDTIGDCAAGGVPMLADASDVLTLPGALQYMTSASMEDIAAFYEEQAAALGAEVSSPRSLSDIAMFDLTKGFHEISITLRAEGALTRVSIASTTGSPVTPATNCAASGSGASGACEAGSIPILSNATNVQSMGALLSYNTSTSLADAAAFYEEQVAALGGQVSSSMPASDMMAMLDVQQGGQGMMVMISSSGNATNVSITSMTGGPLPPSTMCMGSLGAAPAPTEAPAAEPQNTQAQCTAGTASLPIPADAANIQAGSGLLSYTTQMSMADITAFYEEQMAALGGQISTTVPANDMMASFDVTQGNQSVSVIIVSGGGANNVSFTSMNPMNPLSYCMASASATTETATDQGSGECITSAEQVPMLADARNVQNFGGTVTYVTATSMADAVAFYEEQLSPLGEITSPMPASDAMTMLNVTIGDYTISVSITAFDAETRSVSVGFIATDPFAGPPDCSAAASQTGTSSDTSAAACTVSTGTSANQRSGPGTSFAIAGTLAGGTSAAVDGQATGADGFVWWRLGEGVWVRSDVVNATGDCEGVLVVQP
jgi:hypothetical protein